MYPGAGCSLDSLRKLPKDELQQKRTAMDITSATQVSNMFQGTPSMRVINANAAETPEGDADHSPPLDQRADEAEEQRPLFGLPSRAVGTGLGGDGDEVSPDAPITARLRRGPTISLAVINDGHEPPARQRPDVLHGGTPMSGRCDWDE